MSDQTPDSGEVWLPINGNTPFSDRKYCRAPGSWKEAPRTWRDGDLDPAVAWAIDCLPSLSSSYGWRWGVRLD